MASLRNMFKVSRDVLNSYLAKTEKDIKTLEDLECGLLRKAVAFVDISRSTGNRRSLLASETYLKLATGARSFKSYLKKKRDTLRVPCNGDRFVALAVKDYLRKTKGR